MIELLILWQLCRVNREHALAKGQNPGIFTALTIVLWLVPEAVGMLIAYFAHLPIAPYFLGLLLGGAGGAASCIAAKRSKKFDPLES